MRAYLLFCLLFIPIASSGQGALGSWEDHLPYQSMKKIVAGETEIYGATDYAIAVYNKEYKEIRKLSTVHGLTECGISTIGYSNNHNTLIIAYNSTNIDLLHNNMITNIPDLFNKYVSGNKVVNEIVTLDNFAYLITSFGIVLLDLEETEVYDTWNPSLTGSVSEVFDMAISGNNVYACTDNGLLYADINNPALAYFENWNPVPGFSQDRIFQNIEPAGDNLFLTKKSIGPEGDSLLILKQGSLSSVSSGVDQIIYSLDVSGDLLIVSKGAGIDIYNSNGEFVRAIDNYGWGLPSCRDATIDGSKIFIADYNSGIVLENSIGSYESVVIPGPYYNSAANIYSEDGAVFIAGGVLNNAWDNTWNSFQSYIFQDRKWSSYLYYDSWDVMRIRPWPGNISKRYVSTWGSGVYILDNQGIVEHFDENNSPLQSIIPGSKYVRICGLAFDQNNYLWLTQTGVENSIKVLKPDNTWLSLPYTIDAPTIGDIIITRTGKKWIVLPKGNGLFILDDNQTPENFGDDSWKKLNVKDQDGKILNNIYSIEEDIEGNIWIGTDQGPAVFYNPERVFNEEINCYRIKVPRNDGSGLADYLLGTEIINSICVDGGNRKWFGTNSSGIFLVSEDGKKLINSYTESNSPLLSDNITSIDINDLTGEVWIGTDKGVITLRGEATSGDGGFRKVYAFPNPVRSDYNGILTVTGLEINTNVKITDVSGNLVYETTSTGGQATWDLMNYKGNRVSSGVYLAFCSTSDGNTSEVIKILIIR